MRLYDVCQWDFLSYDEALNLSPGRNEIIHYRKDENPDSMFELEVLLEPFGFFSWLPSSANDVSLIMEYKLKPKLWTPFRVPQDELFHTRSIAQTIEQLLRQYDENAGVSCSGKRADGWEFLVGLARRKSTPARYAYFFVEDECLKMSQNPLQQVQYFDSLVYQILFQCNE